jgi:hypothetical protein
LANVTLRFSGGESPGEKVALHWPDCKLHAARIALKRTFKEVGGYDELVVLRDIRVKGVNRTGEIEHIVA